MLEGVLRLPGTQTKDLEPQSASPDSRGPAHCQGQIWANPLDTSNTPTHSHPTLPYLDLGPGSPSASGWGGDSSGLEWEGI